jgi:hypothetical protein
MNRIDTTPSVRVLPLARFRAVAVHECHEPADAGARHGLSQLERGHVTLLDDRMCGAMKAAIENAIHDIAVRFNLDAKIVNVAAKDFAANFQLVLAVKNRKS